MNTLQCSEQIGIFYGHTFPITSLIFSRDGETLISGGDDTIRLWNVTSGKVIRTLKGHVPNWSESAVTSVALSPNGKFIASGGTDNTIRIWHFREFLQSNRGNTRLLTGHSQKSWLITGVRAVAFSADGKILATGGSDKVIKLWNTKTWQEISTLTGYPDAITSVAFSPFSQTLISAASSTIRLLALERNEETILTAPAPLSLVAFNTQGQIFISYGGKVGLSSETIKAWKEFVVEALHSQEIKAVTFSPNGQFFATGGYDKVIKLWSTRTRQLISTFSGHSDAIYSLAFCPDSSILASGSADKTIRLWKVPITSPAN